MASDSPARPLDSDPPLNICFMVGEFPVLSQTFLLNKITGLIDARQQVNIVSHRTSGERVVQREVIEYDLASQMTVCRRGGTRLSSLVKLLVRRFWRRRPNLSLRGYKRTFSRIERAPDIVHACFGPNGVRALHLRDKGAFNCPIVTSFHGYDLSQYLRSHGEDVYDDLFRRSDLFLPVCRYYRDRLVRLGCPSGKILVHPSGIDPRYFVPVARPRSATLHLLSVGRFVEKKGFDIMIEALAILAREGVPIRYTLLGGGPLDTHLRTLATRRGLGHLTRFLGAQPASVVRSALGEADILVAPSVVSRDGDEDTIPNVLKEAMATGMPVVGTHHGGLPELIEHGVTGLLVPERDPSALAEQILVLHQDPATREEMGLAGRRHVEAHYDIRTLNGRLLAILRAVTRGFDPVAAGL